jgi:hypothetical protein
MAHPKGYKMPREHVEKMIAARKRPLRVRFEKFLKPGNPDECWPWQGCHNGVGYGMLRVDSVHRLATHVSLELDGRPRPSPEMFALHACDNPICVNPHHLSWGTRKQNAVEAVERGRVVTGCQRGHGPEHQFREGSERRRRCRVCQSARTARRAAARRESRSASQ